MAKDFVLTRRAALKLLGGGLALPLVGRTETVRSERMAPQDAGPSTLLFFDDEPLFSRHGITRRLGLPHRLASYHETAGNCTWGRPAVFRADDGRWRMVYQAGVGKRNLGGGVMLLAASDDGIDWQPFDTRGLIELPRRVADHQILPADAGNYCSVLDDPRAPASERYKLLATTEREKTSIWHSPDLLHWRCHPGRSWHPNPPDPPAFPFWNPVAGRAMITTRPEWPDRRVCLIETDDWREFTSPRLILNADADDRAMAQHYGLYVLPYEGYFIGMLWVFYAGDASPRSAPHRYRGGKVETYLAYSLNGMHWQRCFHAPLFRNGDAGAPDAGCLQISNLVPLPDGTIRAYGACSTSEHGICPPEDGHIVTYELRRDGFVGLEAEREPGMISTRALFWRGGEVSLNVSAARGAVRVQVIEARGRAIAGYGFEDCIPGETDELAWKPRWREGRTLDALRGRMLRLEIEVRDATLYALRGDFVLVRLGGLERWEKSHQVPTAQAGI